MVPIHSLVNSRESSDMKGFLRFLRKLGKKEKKQKTKVLEFNTPEQYKMTCVMVSGKRLPYSREMSYKSRLNIYPLAPVEENAEGVTESRRYIHRQRVKPDMNVILNPCFMIR